MLDKLAAPAPETSDCWETADTDVHVATSLEAALDDLEADQKIVEAIGPEFVEAFLAVKRAEWHRYQTFTTDWELNEYLDFL